MGLPAMAFTDHADYTPWKVIASDLDGHEQLAALVTSDGTLTPLRLDLTEYLECRALEVNTAVPLHPTVVRWWGEEGGEAVTFGSDAHDPTLLASGFTEAAALVESHGFRPGRHPFDVWTRMR